jgi:predicted ester cyclase
MEMSSEQNKQNARRIFEEVMNRGNLQLVNELVADDYRLREPEGLPAGREGMLTLVQAYRTAFPDLRTTVEEMIAEGDTVAVRWSGTGTQSGTFMGRPPSGPAGPGQGDLVAPVQERARGRGMV